MVAFFWEARKRIPKDQDITLQGNRRLKRQGVSRYECVEIKRGDGIVQDGF